MKRKSFLAGVAVLAAGLVFVSGSGAATTTTVTLTVNSTADSSTACTVANHKSTGTCTLRGAILAADNFSVDNTHFIVKLAAKTYHLSLGTLSVDAATNTGNIVQIAGATKTTGKGKHKKTMPGSIIDGSGNVKPASVFEIDSPTQMANVVVTGGSGDSGGGIWMQSALDMQNSLVTGNTSCGSWNGNTCYDGSYSDGGGIFLGGSSTTPHLSLFNTTVTKNVAYYGGGISNENRHHTSVFILNSHIDKNIACETFSHGVCVGDGGGGGIYDYGESLYLGHSTVNGNQAGSLAYDVSGHESWGGGIYMENDAAQLFHTTVNGNVSGNYGGGIYADEIVDLVNSSVSNNIADYEGGGIYTDYLLTSKNSTFSNNVAGGTFECTIGGSKTTCKHSNKTLNGTCATLYASATACLSFDGQGGGVFSDYEYPQFLATNISNNLAASITGDAKDCGGGQGGGVWSAWTFTMDGGSKVTGNTADCGGGVYNYFGGSTNVYTFDFANSLFTKNTALEDGGAIWTMGPGSGTLYGMKIFGNKAGRQTGGVWSDGVGSVLYGPGNKIVKNLAKGACKNVLWPCS